MLAVLGPMWHDKTETARRVRGRIEAVLDAAKAKGFREGENPAAWKGNLAQVLPRAKRLQRGHHPAMPWRDVPAFYARLAAVESPTALALRFVILTAARAGEVRGMTDDEIEGAMWTVPAPRMKAGREHRVPLSAEALTVLEAVRALPLPASDLTFPSIGGRQLSDMAFNMMLRRMEQPFAAHGFRSSFRDWVDEATSYPGDLGELALAHQVGDETERAYRRGDGLEKRRQLMADWGAFVTGKLPAAL